MRLDCIGFGALSLDKLYRVERIAKAGEESFITGYEEHPGGSAANTMIGLARLGDKVGYIGKVANDDGGRLLLHSFIDEGVDISGVVKAQAGRSGLVMGFIDRRGERTLYVDPGANDTLEFEEIDQTYVADAEFLHMTSFVGERPFQAQKKLLDANPSIRLSFDPGELYARRGMEAMRSFLRRSYVAFPNENELRLLTDEGPDEGAKALLKEGVEVVAVKLGERGCYVTDGREAYYVRAFEVRVVDATGAGDAFCAGFLHGLIKGNDLFECARLGNLVASKKLTKPGARAGLPRLQDLGL